MIGFRTNKQELSPIVHIQAARILVSVTYTYFEPSPPTFNLQPATFNFLLNLSKNLESQTDSKLSIFSSAVKPNLPLVPNHKSSAHILNSLSLRPLNPQVGLNPQPSTLNPQP